MRIKKEKWRRWRGLFGKHCSCCIWITPCYKRWPVASIKCSVLKPFNPRFILRKRMGFEWEKIWEQGQARGSDGAAAVKKNIFNALWAADTQSSGRLHHVLPQMPRDVAASSWGKSSWCTTSWLIEKATLMTLCATFRLQVLSQAISQHRWWSWKLLQFDAEVVVYRPCWNHMF